MPQCTCTWTGFIAGLRRLSATQCAHRAPVACHSPLDAGHHSPGGLSRATTQGVGVDGAAAREGVGREKVTRGGWGVVNGSEHVWAPCKQRTQQQRMLQHMMPCAAAVHSPRGALLVALLVAEGAARAGAHGLHGVGGALVALGAQLAGGRLALGRVGARLAATGTGAAA